MEVFPFDDFSFQGGSETSASDEQSLDYFLPENELNCGSPMIKKDDWTELLINPSTSNNQSNNHSRGRSVSNTKPKSAAKLSAENKKMKAMKRDALAKRRHSHTSKEPTRDEFPDEATFLDTWKKWRQIRDNNNAAVKKSRENLKKKKLETENLCEKREKQHAGLEYEITLLRDHVQLLVRAVRDAGSLDTTERKEVQNLCYEETALVA